VLRIPVSVQVVIGTARLPLAQVAELAPGATVTLEEKLGTPARVLVNGREVARGELFVLDGEGDRLGLTITEVAGNGQPSS
jgi:flagellar motor switch protein FliN/FliY